MQTGYDNYWMYNNCRPQLVHNSPKNDSFSRPVYPDNYKQVQGMGDPSNLYNYISPQNNIARPSQKALNNQQRVTNSQSVWPSSVYSLPYRSPQTHSIHSKEAFQGQPNNMCHLSQPLQNHNLRHLQNSNVNFSQVQNVNYSGSVNNQTTENAKTQAARLKVKDVYSLNNNATQNSLLSNLLQAPQKKQQYYPYNSAMVKQRQMYNSETQREFVNYDSISISDMNHSYQHYGSAGRHLSHISDNQQYVQPSSSYFQQSAQFPCDTQLHFNNVQQMGEKTSSKTFNERNYSLLRVMPNKNITQEPGRMDSSNLQNGNIQSKGNSFEFNMSVNSERIPYSHAVPSTGSGFRFQSQSQPHLVQPPKISPISPAGEPPHPLPKSPLRSQTNKDFKAVSAAAAPHPGQGNFINLADPTCAEPGRISRLPPLPSATSPANAPKRNSLSREQESGGMSRSMPEICEGDATCRTPNRSTPRSAEQICSKEPAIRCRSGETENPPGGVVAQPGGGQTACPKEPVLDCLLTPKVEKVQGEDDFEGGEAGCGEAMEKKIKTEQMEQPAEEEVYTLKDDEVQKPEEAEGGSEGEVDSDCKTVDDVKSLIEVVDVNEDEDLFEKMEERMAEEKYRSQINRNKLNMLIRFLKKDEMPVQRQKYRSIKEKEPSKEFKKKSRRKLSRMSIVRNKNNEREMVSHITPKCSSKSSSGKKEPEGLRESISSDSCDSLENGDKIIWKEKRKEDPNESSEERERKGETGARGGKPEERRTDNGSAEEKADTPEERKIINIMRAFQNLKNHFCANCDFASPVESIWINVVSGELRCLHCFKKMISKAEESAAKGKKSDLGGVESGEKKEGGERGGGKGEENAREEGFEKKSKRESHVARKRDSELKDADENSISLKEHVKEEVVETVEEVEKGYESGWGEEEEEEETGEERERRCSLEEEEGGVGTQKGRSPEEHKKGRVKEEGGEKAGRSSNPSRHSQEVEDNSGKKNGAVLSKGKSIGEDVKKDRNPTKNKSAGKEEYDSSRRHSSDEQGRSESKNKGEKSGKSSNGKEEKSDGSEKHRKKETDSPERCKKRSVSVEEIVSRKVRIVEETGKDTKLNRMGSQERCVHKCTLKECSQRSDSGEEIAKKEKRGESSGRSKQCRESCGTKTEHGKVKEESEEEETKKRVSCSSQESTGKHKRRRMSLDEGSSRVEELTKKEAKHTSEKSKARRESKEGHKSKTENGKEEEATGKGRKEESHGQRVSEELSKKEAKLIDLLEKIKKKSMLSQKTTSEQTSDIPRRKSTTRETRRKSEDCECLRSQSGRTPSAKHESCGRENGKVVKQERKKHSSEKTGKTSHLKESPEKDAFQKLFEEHNREMEQRFSAKPFKEKQNTKINTTGKGGEKETRKTQEHRKENKKREEEKWEKCAEENCCCCHSKPTSWSKKVECNQEKRKAPSWEAAEGKKQERGQRESPPPSQGKKDKPRECRFGKLTNESDSKKAKLLSKLMKKTKKLSWSLLGDPLEAKGTPKQVCL